METLAKRIEAIRKKAGDTPNSAAKKIGISRQAYVKWEDGDTANMKLGNLMAFCEKYKVEIADLITGQKTVTALSANQDKAAYDTKHSNEARVIADYYDQLPAEVRAEFRASMVKAYLQVRLQHPDVDIGDIGEVITLVRNN